MNGAMRWRRTYEPFYGELYFPNNKLVNLERYPIEDLNSDSARALLAHCRKELDETGSYGVPALIYQLGVMVCLLMVAFRPKAYLEMS